jgi:Kef-type K+ transport system membrane component KefB
MITATSIGITVRVLKDVKKDNTKFARIVLGAAVLDDILGVIFLVVIYDFAVTGTVSVIRTAKVLLFMVLFLLLAPLASLLLSKVIQIVEQVLKPSGFLAPVYVSLLLVLAYLSHAMGVPEILGSFAAGIAMSKRFIVPVCERCNLERGFITKVEDSMRPIVFLFTPVFFVMIGLSIDLHVLDLSSKDFWIVGSVLTAMAILTKLIAGFFTSRTTLLEKTLIGISMIPRGEVGLVFAKLGLLKGVFNDQVFATMIFVVIVTTLLPPFALKFLSRYEL